jgi:hypothetical protein
MAEIEPIRPDVALDSAAFMANMAQAIPEGVPIVVMWMTEDGVVSMRGSQVNRREMCWMAAQLAKLAVL